MCKSVYQKLRWVMRWVGLFGKLVKKSVYWIRCLVRVTLQHLMTQFALRTQILIIQFNIAVQFIIEDDEPRCGSQKEKVNEC